GRGRSRRPATRPRPAPVLPGALPARDSPGKKPAAPSRKGGYTPRRGGVWGGEGGAPSPPTPPGKPRSPASRGAAPRAAGRRAAELGGGGHARRRARRSRTLGGAARDGGEERQGRARAPPHESKATPLVSNRHGAQHTLRGTPLSPAAFPVLRRSPQSK